MKTIQATRAPHQPSRRNFLKITATTAAVLAALFPNNIGNLFAQTPDYKSTLEENITKATKGRIKFDVARLRQHPSPLFANVILVLIMRGDLKEEKSRLPLYKLGESLKLYSNPNEKFDRSLAAIAELLDEVARSKGQTDVQVGRYSQLMLENKPQEANKYLLEVLAKRGLI